MTSLRELELKLAELAAARVVDPKGTQIDVYPDDVQVEVVVLNGRDAARVDEELRAAAGSEVDGLPVTVRTRKKWRIDSVGEPVPALGRDGGLRAATLVPVGLRCGDEMTLVTVSITKLAETSLERLLGRQPELAKKVAEALVQVRLQASGPAAFDPERENYLEVAANGVANLSRLIRQVA